MPGGQCGDDPNDRDDEADAAGFHGATFALDRRG